jgi:hypothetical protein
MMKYKKDGINPGFLGHAFIDPVTVDQVYGAKGDVKI